MTYRRGERQGAGWRASVWAARGALSPPLSSPLSYLDLEHRALRVVHVRQPGRHHGLGEVDDGGQQIGDALAGHGRRRHDGHVRLGVGVLVVQGHIQPLLVERQLGLGEAAVELGDDVGRLRSERGAEARVRRRAPIEQAVNFVERHDERRLAHFEQVDGLDRLRLQAVHQVHHQNRHVAQPRPARAQVGERFVPRRVDDEQARQADVGGRVGGAERGRAADEGVRGDVRRANLLRDAARLPLLHARPPHVVQQLGFSRVDVAQDADDGGAQVAGGGARSGGGEPVGAARFGGGQELLTRGLGVGRLVVVRAGSVRGGG